MRIQEFKIKKLFGYFDYFFDFSQKQENVFIFHGPNGTGKTTILRIINDICSQNFLSISKYFFTNIEVKYDDGSTLSIDRHFQGEDDKAFPYKIFYKKPDLFSKKVKIIKDMDMKKIAELKDDVRRFLREVDLEADINGFSESLGLSSVFNDHVSIYDITDKLHDVLPSYLLREIKKHINLTHEGLPKLVTKFIDTKRLNDKLGSRGRRNKLFRNDAECSIRNPLEQVSYQILNIFKDVLSQYATTSQKLDSSFASEIIKSYTHDGGKLISNSEISRRLNNVRDKAQKLFEAGILDKQDHIIGNETVTEDYAKVLDLYCKNTEEKLEIFDKLYSQIIALTDILNRKFSHKKITVNHTGINISDLENNSKISMSVLSSGEQHQLYLFSDLIFNANQADMILIDEPEISLHVSWQKSFIDDLLSIPGIKHSQIMIATHAPAIIGKRMEGAIDLGVRHKFHE